LFVLKYKRNFFLYQQRVHETHNWNFFFFCKVEGNGIMVFFFHFLAFFLLSDSEELSSAFRFLPFPSSSVVPSLLAAVFSFNLAFSFSFSFSFSLSFVFSFSLSLDFSFSFSFAFSFSSLVFFFLFLITITLTFTITFTTFIFTFTFFTFTLFGILLFL